MAADFVGAGRRIGLGQLIQRQLGVEVAKTQGLTDWRMRPLTDEQLNYAIGDVLYLQDLQAALRQQLDAAPQKRAWFEEEMRTTFAVSDGPQKDKQRHLFFLCVYVFLAGREHPAGRRLAQCSRIAEAQGERGLICRIFGHLRSS